MSNQVNDRYVCSDAKCGCELEVKRPCSMVPSGTATLATSQNAAEPQDIGEVQADRSFGGEPISTPGDFGSQGAGAEGLFGTSGGSNEPVSNQGRYGSSIEKSFAHTEHRFVAKSPTCFCGKPMREAGIGVPVNARAARV